MKQKDIQQYIRFDLLMALKDGKEHHRTDLFKQVSDRLNENEDRSKQTKNTGGNMLTQLVEYGFALYPRGKGTGYYQITPRGSAYLELLNLK